MNLFTLADGRRAFHQWDTGRQLIVHDEACNEVHFCNGSDDSSLVCKVFDKDDLRLVNVPNILLQDTRSITVFAFVEEESGGYTRRAVVYNVRARSKPDDYVYTETEVLNYQTLAKRMDELEKHGISPDVVAGAIKEYFTENPVETGATEEEAAQITKNKEDIDDLKKDKLDASKLPEAVNDALAQAKESGLFDGAPGEPGQPGEPGKDYILTDVDKADIAKLVEVPAPDSGGNVDFIVSDTPPEDTSVLWVDPTDNTDDGFQAAVNTALALAKASGEFDGEPGKDGVVSVTGATVGQTVKISAVDENGVPTAWEPAYFPTSGGDGSGGGTRWEPLVNEVWQRNREFRFTEYNAETLTYTFPDGTFTDDEIGTEIGTRLVLDPNSLPDTHTTSFSYITKLTPISGNQATIPSAQVGTLNGKNYWFEVPTILSIKGINSKKIRLRWDGNVERSFQSYYEAAFAYGMPHSQSAIAIGYVSMHPIRTIVDIELEMIDPFVVSGHQNAYIFTTSANPTYHKKWYQSYAPVLQDQSSFKSTPTKPYSEDGLLFKELHWTNTPWLSNGGVTYFIGNGTRIYIAREVEA